MLLKPFTGKYNYLYSLHNVGVNITYFRTTSRISTIIVISFGRIGIVVLILLLSTSVRYTSLRGLIS